MQKAKQMKKKRKTCQFWQVNNGSIKSRSLNSKSENQFFSSCVVDALNCVTDGQGEIKRRGFLDGDWVAKNNFEISKNRP